MPLTVIDILSRLPYLEKLEPGQLRWCEAYECGLEASWFFKRGAVSKTYKTGRQPSGFYCSHHALKLTKKTRYECARFARAMKKWEQSNG